jgi:hypothetical protein
MEPSAMPTKLSRLFELGRTIARMPVARLQFRRDLNPPDVTRMHQHFTKRHPRYLVCQNKSIGAALVDLSSFADHAGYMDTVKGSNSAALLAARARRKGYRVVDIERNDHIDQIHTINNSVEVRQGRPMDAAYRDKVTHYSKEKNFSYLGVLNPAGELVGYANFGCYGNFVAIDRVIGLRNNDGVMHLLMTDIVGRLIEERKVRYLMYDTCFGASAGLLKFKTMLGFTPYRVKFSIQ